METSDGLTGEVNQVNILRQRIKVLVEQGDEKELKEYAAEELKITKRRRRRSKPDKDRRSKGQSRDPETGEVVSEKELAALEDSSQSRLDEG